MSNPNELRDARRKAEEAARSLAQIRKLPRYVGESVRWPHNGVVWTRAGDDDWRSADMPGRPFPSAHVAMIDWEIVR